MKIFSLIRKLGGGRSVWVNPGVIGEGGYRDACWARGLHLLGTKILWFSTAIVGGEGCYGLGPIASDIRRHVVWAMMRG